MDEQDSFLTAKKFYAATVTGKHIPNKEEAKELRRLMQKSGMTEEQLREHKIYRKKLADARNRGTQEHGNPKYTRKMRELRQIRIHIAELLNTHINDPRLDQETVNEYNRQYIRGHYNYQNIDYIPYSYWTKGEK